MESAVDSIGVIHGTARANLDSLFDAAVAIASPEERAAFLAQACGDNTSLRQEVEKLLASDQAAASFLELRAPELDVTIVPGQLDDARAAALNAGLAAAFPAEAAVIFGDAHHSALKSLGQSMVVPRVVLRESAETGDDPIVRPRSSEMPDRNSDSRYQLQGEIARGGMGAILKGRDTDLGRDLAIKVLLDVHKDKPDVVQRFIEEAQIGGQLQHPGIAPIYELGQFADRRPFFSMKLVKGETLSKLLADRAEPSADRGKFLGIFEQICQTMAYAHSRGVIHRDLKPANIMVGAFGEVQVMDWGLAKVLPAGGVADEKKSQLKQQGQSLIQTLRSKVGSDTPGTVGGVGSQTQMGSVMGTPAYMPPEQALGEIDHLDERADVFGLGAILCEVLTGQPPYVGDDGTQVFRMASRGKLGDCFARLDVCGADAELIALTKHCMKLEPQDRPRDAGVMAERVSAYLESVETRLRETELARAAEAARAESEGKRAEAEGRRAEAERQRAESEGRRLEQQQKSACKLRKMLAGLAAVATIAVGASIVAGQFWQAANVARRNAENSAELAVINAELAGKNAALARTNAVVAQQNEAQALSEAGRANAQTQLAKENLIKAEKARVEADENRNLLRAERDQGRQKLYFAEMILAGIAAEAPSGLGRVRELLGPWGPTAPGANLRGWEWYHLDSQSRNATLTLHGHAGAVFAVAYSPNCQRLATGGADKTVRIWDKAMGREIACLRGHQGAVNCITWSPTGDRLASGAADGTARIWDAASGHELRQLCGPGPSITAIAWRSDGTRVATTGHDMLFHVWDPDTGRQMIGPQGNGNWGMALAWSPDGKKLAFGTWKPEVTVFDGETGAKVTSLQGHLHGVLGVNWSPEGDRLATASWDGTVRIWDPKVGKQQAALNEAQNYLHAVCWSPNGKQIAAGGGNRAVQIWDADSGRARTVLRGNFNDIRALAWSSDGTSIAATTEIGGTHVWDVRPESDLFRANVQAGTAETGFDWARDGRTVTRDGDATTRVWQPKSAKPSLTLNGGKRAPSNSQYGPNGVRFSPDGTKIATGGDDDLVRIWDAASGELLRTLKVRGTPFNVQWSPDGKRIACSGWGWAVAVWDVATGEPVIIPDVKQGGRYFALAWSPSGDRIATAGDATAIRVWDSNSGRLLAEARQKEQVWDISWSPDGRQIASAGWNGSVWVWDAVTGREMLSLRGHSGRVMSIGWSPDGKRIASGSSDHTVKLWDSVSGQEALTLRGHTDTVMGIHWHPDGCQLATRDGRGNVLFWDATPGFMSERSAFTLSGLNEQIQRDPTSVPARQHRAEVLSRQGDWDAAESDFKELARLPSTAAVVYPAGWWTLDGPEDKVPTFPPSTNDAPARWLAPADDPNGFVRLPTDRTTAVTRIFAPSRTLVALDIGPNLPKRLWLNEKVISTASLGMLLVELKEGWNSLVIQGGPREQFVRWRDYEKPADNAERLRFARAAALAINEGDPDVLPFDAAAKARLRVQVQDSLKSALSVTTNRFDKTRIIEAATLLPGLLPELAKFAPNDGPFHAELARHFASRGEFLDADSARMKARTVFEQQLTKEQENSALAADLAELLLDRQWHEHVRWTVLQPAEMQNISQVKLTVQDDKSILVGPAPASQDVPELVRWQPGPSPIQALRIETSSQTNMPTDGSFSFNEYQIVAANMATSQAGAFQGQFIRIDLPGDNSQFPRHPKDADKKIINLAELQVFQGDQNIALRKRARQSSSYDSLLVAACAVDGNTTGNDQGNPYAHTWGEENPWWEVDLGQVQAIDRIVVWNRIEFNLATRMNHFRVRVLDQTRKVVFEQVIEKGPNPSTEIVRPVLLPETLDPSTSQNQPLTLQLHPRDAPYRLRVSVASNLADLSSEHVHLPSDPWEKLAVAYHFVDEQQALNNLLERHPMAAAAIGDLYATNKNWDRAIAEYTKLLGLDSTAEAVLTKRATAYLAIEKWDLAQADWRRIVAQEPKRMLSAVNEFKIAERWKEAAEFGLQFIKQNQDDTLRWLTIAPILVLADDQATYSEFCSRMAQHFAKSELPEVPDRVLKATLLRANSVDLTMLPVNKLAKSLDEGTFPEDLKQFGWGARALFAYRSDDAESAVKFVAKAEAYKPTEFYHLLNLSVLAMAQHRLQHTEEAQRSLAEASKLVISLKTAKGKHVHHDLLIAQIIFHEAKTLINGNGK